MKIQCPLCVRTFTQTASLKHHLRISHKDSTSAAVDNNMDPPQNRLFSRYATADEFVFENVITITSTRPTVLPEETTLQNNDNSFYSDVGSNYDFINDDIDDDFDPSTLVRGANVRPPHETINVNVADDESIEDNALQYFTPPSIPDADVPFSGELYGAGNSSFTSPAHLTAQLQLNDLFNRNKGSLKMYDDVIKIINTYVNLPTFDKFSPLIKRQPFLNLLDELFNTSTMRPTYGSIRLYDGSLATVPVYDMKTMILSILHDDTLMRTENFAPGLDIFTGDVDDNCDANNYFGEIHTGDAWLPAKNRICGSTGLYMPFGIVVFGDKSNTDQHGALSVTPITFTATFFNREVRNNPDCWRPMAYLPNMGHRKGRGGKSSDKSQDEHNCLAFALKSLIELSEAGGIRTVVMGKDVHVKPFIHYFIGDTEGLNKWLGHYNGSKPGVSRPYRDCHYNFIGMNASNPSCVYTTASEFRRAMRLVARNRKDGMTMLESMSRHCVNNALYQSRLPLSDMEHGANKMCPPEVLHTMDAGLTMYMLESLQRLVGEGLCRDLLDKQHVIMFYRMKRQSEQDTPRGSVRNGLIDTTRCQSSERKGNFFLLMCIAHTTAGSALLKDKLGHNNR